MLTKPTTPPPPIEYPDNPFRPSSFLEEIHQLEADILFGPPNPHRERFTTALGTVQLDDDESAQDTLRRFFFEDTTTWRRAND